MATHALPIEPLNHPRTAPGRRMGEPTEYTRMLIERDGQVSHAYTTRRDALALIRGLAASATVDLVHLYCDAVQA